MMVEKMMMAIASEKTRKPSSLAQLCSVEPRMRSPAECRENLKILQHQSRGHTGYTVADDISSILIVNVIIIIIIIIIIIVDL